MRSGFRTSKGARGTGRVTCLCNFPRPDETEKTSVRPRRSLSFSPSPLLSVFLPSTCSFTRARASAASTLSVCSTIHVLFAVTRSSFTESLKATVLRARLRPHPKKTTSSLLRVSPTTPSDTIIMSLRAAFVSTLLLAGSLSVHGHADAHMHAHAQAAQITAAPMLEKRQGGSGSAALPQCQQNPDQPLCASLAALASQYLDPLASDGASLLAAASASGISIDTAAVSQDPAAYLSFLPSSDQALYSSYQAGVSSLIANNGGVAMPTVTMTSAPTNDLAGATNASSSSTVTLTAANNATLSTVVPAPSNITSSITNSSSSSTDASSSSSTTASSYSVDSSSVSTGMSFSNTPSTFASPTGASTTTRTSPSSSSSSAAAVTDVANAGLLVGAVVLGARVLFA